MKGPGDVQTSSVNLTAALTNDDRCGLSQCQELPDKPGLHTGWGDEVSVHPWNGFLAVYGGAALKRVGDTWTHRAPGALPNRGACHAADFREPPKRSCNQMFFEMSRTFCIRKQALGSLYTTESRCPATCRY